MIKGGKSLLVPMVNKVNFENTMVNRGSQNILEIGKFGD
jgi:hypothetical protein